MADTKPSLKNPEDDDADIEDLLIITDKTNEEEEDDNNKKGLKGAMDKLSGNNSQQDEAMIQLLPSKTAVFSICELLFAYISLFILNRPKQCSAFVGISLLVIILVVNLTLKNASDGASPDSIIGHDYSDIKSQYEMNIGKVDHWCLQGGDQHCRCEDPLRSVRKKAFPVWEKAFQKNIDSIEDALFEDDEYLDVVFLGENIVEYWSGSSLSFNSSFVYNVSRNFNKQFKGDSKIRGLPLGIAGDTTSNVLWRIQNGEMPVYLNPKIWWLVLGTNDLAMKQCSEEVVLMGILRIIEEILEKKPDAKIVVNSILPMTSDMKGGRVPRITKKDRKKVHTAGLGHDLGFRRKLAKKDKEEDGIGQEGKLTQGEDVIKAIKHEMKPRKPARVRVRRGPLRWASVSMWPSVEAVNYGLQQFASKHKRVSFFNAYDIFVEEEDKESTPKIIKDLTKSFAIGQPSVAGHKELVKGIKQRLRDMLNKMQKKGKAEKIFDDGEKEAKVEEIEKKEKKMTVNKEKVEEKKDKTEKKDDN